MVNYNCTNMPADEVGISELQNYPVLQEYYYSLLKKQCPSITQDDADMKLFIESANSTQLETVEKKMIVKRTFETFIKYSSQMALGIISSMLATAMFSLLLKKKQNIY